MKMTFSMSQSVAEYVFQNMDTKSPAAYTNQLLLEIVKLKEEQALPKEPTNDNNYQRSTK